MPKCYFLMFKQENWAVLPAWFWCKRKMKVGEGDRNFTSTIKCPNVEAIHTWDLIIACTNDLGTILKANVITIKSEFERLIVVVRCRSVSDLANGSLTIEIAFFIKFKLYYGYFYLLTLIVFCWFDEKNCDFLTVFGHLKLHQISNWGIIRPMLEK